ncbi:hypothetical protein [Parasphingorhabdus sp.]|jgi:hypothetical protein|uniref:hypothetical protein n=1 Tax=Parasphingorhabdus sp. TaxID=2709688 RepID=UPI0030A52548|nr:hypothetical protein [Sphingomonadales bacterium]
MPSFYAIPLAFILGFALSWAATCTVAATSRWVNQGKIDWLFGLLTGKKFNRQAAPLP